MSDGPSIPRRPGKTAWRAQRRRRWGNWQLPRL